MTSETGYSVTRTKAQGAKSQPEIPTGVGSLATEPTGRGDSFFYRHAETALPKLWDQEVPKALKSLIQMGIVRSLDMNEDAGIGSNAPPLT